MWEMKSELAPLGQLQPSKDSTDESRALPWSYRPLEIQEVRWYWNKQPYSLKGIFTCRIDLPMPGPGPLAVLSLHGC